MLINFEKQTLIASEFKKFYKKLDWQKVERKLSESTKDIFYIGKYEDDNKIVKVSLRPSLRMQVMETFKNRDTNGKEVKKTSGVRQKIVNYGCTVEVLVEEGFVKKVEKISRDSKPEKVQKVKL